MKRILLLSLMVGAGMLLAGGCVSHQEQSGAGGAARTVPVPETGESAPVPAGLLLVGETEYVTIVPASMRMAARIDTGATTSSIGAYDIKRFERDGKPWVKFTVRDPQTGKSARLSEPVSRTIEVKQHGAPARKRLVVSLPVIMGPVKTRTEFSLADRSTFKYPVLIGRSFLKGVAVVDVNQEYVLSSVGSEGNEK